jgi:hypothetical protein
MEVKTNSEVKKKKHNYLSDVGVLSGQLSFEVFRLFPALLNPVSQMLRVQVF